MKLSKFSRFKIFTNKFEEFVIFLQTFSRSVEMSSRFVLLCVKPTESKTDGKDQEWYNQVPHLTQNTTWESDTKTQLNITNTSQEVSPSPAGDY